jgi:AraC-like DNA-binding protein
MVILRRVLGPDHVSRRHLLCSERQNETTALSWLTWTVVGRPLTEPKLRTALVPALLRFARVRGVLVSDLSPRLSLGVEGRDPIEALVDLETLRALFETVADRTGEPHVGLRLASEQQLSQAHAPLEEALRASCTVGQALVSLARVATLIHPAMTVEVSLDETGARWVQAMPRDPRAVDAHAEEYGLAFVLTRCRELCPSDAIRVSSMSWVRARPRDVAPLQRFFGTQALTFGAEVTSFTLPRSVAEAPLAVSLGRDGVLGASSGPSLASLRTAATVAAKLPALLPDHATLDRAAAVLAVSARTLQRRLEEEGTSFVATLDTVREALARDLLRDPALTLLDVAERLGFSDLATFSRAFKRWTGQPPGTYRRNL